MPVFVHATDPETPEPAEADPRRPGGARVFEARWAENGGPSRPADVRAEHDAAIHLLLRLTSLALVRVVSLLVVDLAALLAAGGVLRLLGGPLGIEPPASAMRVFVLLAYGVVLGIAANGAYGAGDRRRDVARLTRGVLLGAAGTFFLARGLDITPIALAPFLVLTALSVILVVAGRLATDAVTRWASPSYLRRRVLLIGDRDSAASVLRHFNGSVRTRLRVEGRLARSQAEDPGADGELADLRDFLREHPVDVVVVTSVLPESALRHVVTTAFRRGVHVELVPTAVRDSDWMIQPQILFGCPVLEVRPSRLGVPQLALKRAFDLLFATALVILLLPLFVLIAVAIKVDSRGPVVFRQARAGLWGRPFTILKFRTMVFDADRNKGAVGHLNDSGDPRLFKISRDPRVTRVGRLLRVLSLDELPQLLNIIRGEMSFVGPRPFFREDLDLYEPHHYERLSVLPGLTGLWQVSGRSEIREWESVVQLDREYIRNWSLLLDFKIMLKTVPALARRNGAF